MITEILVRSKSAITISRLSIHNASVGVVLKTSAVLLTSFAILIANEYISELKKRLAKLKDWIKVVTSSNENTLETSMVGLKN